MRYSFSAISSVIKRILRLLAHQVTLLYDYFVNKALFLSTFLYLGYSYISAKSRLIKKIVLNFFVILLACMNLTYIYLKLFLNRRQLSSSTTGMLAMPATTSLYSIGSPAYSLSLLPNSINLNLL